MIPEILISCLMLRPVATQQSQSVLAALRSELRAESHDFRSQMRRLRDAANHYQMEIDLDRIKTPEQGEDIFDRLYEIRIKAGKIRIPDTVAMHQILELRESLNSHLLEAARQTLDLDIYGSWDYEPWQILASARRYVIKLRAVPLREITARQILEAEMEGLAEAEEFIAGVPAEGHEEQIAFVWGQISATRDNVIARISELEKKRSELRRAA